MSSLIWRFLMFTYLFTDICSSFQEPVNFENDNVSLFPVLPESSLHLAGRDIKLKCSTKGGSRATGSIVWIYKKCSPEYKWISCELAQHMPPFNILCANHLFKRCPRAWNIFNSSEAQSGLYSCWSVTQEKLTHIVTHRVEIIDPVSYPPEIIEGTPHNLTVKESLRAVLYCTVYSRTPVQIFWFRQIEKSNNQDGVYISYLEAFYEKLENSRESEVRMDVYNSTLRIEKSQLSDAGMYACIALNNLGLSHNTAYLDVVPNSTGKTFYSYDKYFLPLMYTIPVIIVVPLLLWICLATWKRCRKAPQQNVTRSVITKDADLSSCVEYRQMTSAQFV